MNKVILSLLCAIIVIISIILYTNRIQREKFVVSHRDPKKELIHNLLPGFDNEILGTFIPKKEKTREFNNLIYCRSLLSNTWYGPVENGKVKNHILSDLCYSPDRRLIGIFMTLIGPDQYYSLYIKQSRDIKSRWVLLDDSENIRSIIFDLDGKLMGCHAITGQIYKKRTEELNSEWVETNTFDVPMKKLIFDKDLYLMGIGMADGKLYKKLDYFWSESLWDTENIGSDTIFDCYHDFDGCLIASSYKGIVKQTSANYMDNFLPIREVKPKRKILSLTEILRFKTGLVLEDDLILDDTSDLGNDLKEILKYKKQAIKLCKNKSTRLKNIGTELPQNNSRNIQLVNKQSQMINNLESMIKKLENSLH